MATQVNTLTQMAHGQQMLFPLVVQNAQRLFASQYLSDVTGRDNLGQNTLTQPIFVQIVFSLQPLGNRHLFVQLGNQSALQSFYIPLFFQTFGRNKLVNNGVHHLSTQIGDGFAHIIGIQQTVPLGVDHLTLIVSQIIVFEQILTNIEVATFDFTLGFFDGVGDHAML